MENRTQIVDVTPENDSEYLSTIVSNGPCALKMRSFLMSEYDEHGEEEANNIVSSILLNSLQCMGNFASPNCKYKRLLSKVLCIGRVQSGKTSFFLGCLAYAFDNGINLAFVLGGTKNNLLSQNVERLEKAFSNNPDVVIYSVKDKTLTFDKIGEELSSGKKVIIASLKQSGKTNMGRLEDILRVHADTPVVVVDDEGDEYSPGSRLKNAGNRVKNRITSFFKYANSCTYMAVTATPQANLLLSTLDELSPNRCFLVEPGKGYIGLEAYDKEAEGKHLVEIYDTDDFSSCGVPKSFRSALKFFVGSCAIKRLQDQINKPFSMMVHPSSSQDVQIDVFDKVRTALNDLVSELSYGGDGYKDFRADFEEVLQWYYRENPDIHFDDTNYFDEVQLVLSNIGVYLENSRFAKFSNEREEAEDKLYRIYVGGNMLGRGLTIRNLSTTYIYRDSKAPMVDTVYQRARWLGYKSSYFDICRVYMTSSLVAQFEEIGNHEQELWSDLRNFLDVERDMRKFNRVFTLDVEKTSLSLTRPSVAKTIPAGIAYVGRGWRINSSGNWTDEELKANQELFNGFFNKHFAEGEAIQYAAHSEWQTHFVAEMKFSVLFEEFIKKYIFPRDLGRGSINLKMLTSVLNQIESDPEAMPDRVTFMVLRYKTVDDRAPTYPGSKTVRQLMQGYDPRNRDLYPGDRTLPGFDNKIVFAIHRVCFNGDDESKWMPMITFRLPNLTQAIGSALTKVTGDNYYGE